MHLSPLSPFVRAANRAPFVVFLILVALALLPLMLRAQGAGWQGLDIGAVGLAGDDDEADGVVTVSGSGADIYGARDALHFRARTLAGDGALIARIADHGSGHVWAKVGLMFREDLGDDAREVMLFVTPGNHYGLQYRSAVGGATTSIDLGYLYDATPWLMLVRQGNTFRAYHSLDGLYSWDASGSVTVPMAAEAYGGQAVSSHDNSALVTATFDSTVHYAGPPPPLFPPAPPLNLRASDWTPTRIHLTWDPVAVAERYELERADGDYYYTPAFTPIAVLPAGTTDFIDSGLAPHHYYIYRVRAWRDSVTVPYSSYSPHCGASTTYLPPPGYDWNFGASGFSSLTGGTLTLTAGGTGIGGMNDSCLMYYWRASADLDFKARITAIDPTDPLAEAGLMIRTDVRRNYHNDTAHAAMTLAAGGTSRFVSRAADGLAAQVVAGPNVTLPYWVRMTRVGDRLSGYISPDGSTWTLVGSQRIDLGADVALGFVASSHADSTRGKSTFDRIEPALETPPEYPTGVRVTTVAPGYVRLAWNDNSTNEAGFDVGRRLSSDGTATYTIMSVPANATSFEDTTVAPNTSYGYSVRASRGSGGVTEWSGYAGATTPATPELPAPGNLRVTAVTQTDAYLAWDDNSTTETGFYLERRNAGGSTFSLVASPPANTTTHHDPGLAPGSSYEYRVRAVGSASGSYSGYSPVVPVTTASAAAWTGNDIGAVGAAGSDSLDGQTLVMQAGGGDFWGNADAGRFYASAWHGDGTITVRVAGLANTNPWAKAGVMIRESTAANARNVALLLSAGNVSGLQSRSTVGGETEFTAGPWVNPSYWVKLVRDGDVFTGYVSADGGTWTLVGSKTVVLPVDVLLGVAASAHSNGPQTTATFDHLLTAGGAAAPAAPGNLRISWSNSSSIGIAWDDNSPAEDGFDIVREANADGTYWLIATVPANTTSYTDTGLTAGTLYRYKVQSIAHGISSNASNIASTRTPADTGAVTAPFNFHVELGAPTTLRLAWSETSPDETGFEIAHRVRGAAAYEVVATVPANTTTYDDTGLTPATAYEYRLRTVKGGVYSDAVFLETYTMSAEGESWTGTDIGAVGVAGSTDITNESPSGITIFTLKAGGGDIEGAADAFRYEYRQWHGDGSITARVSSLTNTHPWAKAGVMIRETFADNSANAAMVLTAGNACGFQARATAGGATEFTSGPWVNPTYWVRLTRAGNVFSGYVSPDGSTWTLVGTRTVAMGADVLIGLAASAHSPGAQTTAVFSPIQIAAPTPASRWVVAQYGGTNGTLTEPSPTTTTLTAKSGDYWGTSDSGLFGFVERTGDVTVTARLTRNLPASDWTKAGLMIRPTAGDAAGVNAFIAFTGFHGHVFQARSVAGTQTTSQGDGQAGATQWLKLTRVGSTFSGYISLDDRATWTLVGTASITMRPEIQVGMALSSHDTANASSVTFADFTVE